MTNNQNTYNQPAMGEQEQMQQMGMPPQEAMMPHGPMMPAQQMPVRRMGRRERWGKMLMAGNALIKQSLPNWFATFAFGTYAVALLGVNLVYSSYATEWYFWLFGIVWVAGFFFLSVKFSQEWSITHIRKSKTFERKLFWTGIVIRFVYVIFIYYFYSVMNGVPYEFQSADSQSYIEVAGDWASWYDRDKFWAEILEYINVSGISDLGYPLSLMLPVYWFGEEAAVIITRLIQAVLGAYTSVIIYRIVSRSMGETTARFAAIFCMLHPVLVCYAGMSLKEVLMTCLLVIFIDMGDRMLRSRQYSFATIAPLALAGFSLFMFRTVLGLVAIMAVFFALVMIDTRIISMGKRMVLAMVLIGLVLLGASEHITREVDKIRETNIQEQQETSMTKRYGTEGGKKTGNAFAKYAGAAVFAPLIFTIPFPTMVVTHDQEDIRLIHGGNWMRNVMSGFVILAMFMLLLSGDWRKYTLPLAMMLGYLLMLAFTEFAHSLRFHIPVMPFEMMFSAYAITNMRKKHKNWYLIWCFVMMIACFAWNWFKLAGRGLA